MNPLSLTSDNEIQLTVQYRHMQLKQDRVHISESEMLFNIWFSKEQLQPWATLKSNRASGQAQNANSWQYIFVTAQWRIQSAERL
jgi:hypothetical protein